MGLPFSELMGYTYKQLVVTYDAFIMSKWDHTAYLAQSLENILSVVTNYGSKSQPQYVTFQDVHPLRKSTTKKKAPNQSSSDKDGITIKLGPGQMKNLKAVAMSIHSGRR